MMEEGIRSKRNRNQGTNETRGPVIGKGGKELPVGWSQVARLGGREGAARRYIIYMYIYLYV